jgi:hypothetical protein
MNADTRSILKSSCNVFDIFICVLCAEQKMNICPSYVKLESDTTRIKCGVDFDIYLYKIDHSSCFIDTF